MKTINEPVRETPIVEEVDVAVAGGGPAGYAAAVAAARQGAKVLLLERYGFLGGMATAGMVAPILAHTAAQNSETPIVEGILKETTERMHQVGGSPAWEDACQAWGIRFDAEAFKYIAEQMVQEAGVRILLHSFIVDAITDTDNRIQCLVIENKSGRQAISARLFVDATGDGDVAASAGAPMNIGREFDGRVEAMGAFFQIDGIPELTKARAKEIIEQFKARLSDGESGFYAPRFMSNNTMRQDFYAPNITRLGGHPTDVYDLTAAEITNRDNIWKLLKYLWQEVPEMKDCYLRHIAPQIGLRESRQIEGDYMLTGDDIIAGNKFDDAITRGSWWIDIHCPLGRTYPVHLCTSDCVAGKDCPFWVAEHDKTMCAQNNLHPPADDWYDIPYRCLTPKKIPNLLVAGRCISATHQGMAGARVMGTCVAMGQAAGTAAALAVDRGINTREVNVQNLRTMLQNDGALV